MTSVSGSEMDIPSSPSTPGGHHHSQGGPLAGLAASLATSISSMPSSSSKNSSLPDYHFGTLCATAASKDQHGASSVPIYQTATFKGAPGSSEYDYTRSGNPTRSALEGHLAQLYGCTRTFALSTGMTALDVILRLVRAGDVIIAGDDIYGGTDRLLTYMKDHGMADVRHVDLSLGTTAQNGALTQVLRECGSRVRMVLVESPTNPLLKVADVRAIASAAHTASSQALVVVDNTMMSPALQRPLQLGADIVYDSGTKYLSGHHDVMAGVVAVDEPELSKRVAHIVNSTGTGLSPFDSFLLLRGLKTLALRMDRQQASARVVARYLDALGFKVNFPGLVSHPGRDVHFGQATGAGAVLSFTTGDVSLSERIVGATRLWGISVSFGCVNSLISMPCVMSHASISAAKRAERGLPEDLIRLCVGIEDARDLIDDLERALVDSGAIHARFDIASEPGTPGSTAFEQDAESWAVDRAMAYRRGNVLGGGVGGADDDDEEPPIVVSAPGKVILFGEHAVVHGVTAIAASVNLRCFAILTPRRDERIDIELPDIGLTKDWAIADLPWSEFASVDAAGQAAAAPNELDPRSLAALEAFLHNDGLSAPAHSAALAILYLYMAISSSSTESSSSSSSSISDRRGFSFTARSALPISAGLGSSASYASCIAASLLLLHKRASIAPSGVEASQTEHINGWAFLAEKVIHGNPSGIDNAVAIRGGAVAFARAVNGQPGRLDAVRGFKSIRFLLTDTRVPRNTKALVAGVGAKLQAQPEVYGKTLESIQAISDEAITLLSQDVPRQQLVDRLSTLMDENHGHLVDLEVSHPSLEAIRAKTSATPFKLSSKLTGAGGGGCAVTLIPDDFSDALLEELTTSLETDGFRPYLTSVGGSGLGILHAPSPAIDVKAPGAGERSHIPLQKVFRDVDAEGLSQWAERTGKWAYT